MKEEVAEGVEELASVEERQERWMCIRFGAYWISSTLATIVFLAFTYFMSMVPGVPTVQKLWMLCVGGCLLIVPLLIGAWRFNTTEAPIRIHLFATFLGALSLIELAVCIVGMIQVSLATPIH